MDKYKLEKFNAKCDECGGRAIAEVEIYNEKYIYNLEQNLKSLQQLKAEIKKAYMEGYSKGHNDTVESGDYCPEQSADDWLSELSAVQ